MVDRRQKLYANVDEEQKDIVRRAACLRGCTVAEFVRTSSLNDAMDEIQSWSAERPRVALGPGRHASLTELAVERANVVVYLRRNPGATAKDVGRDVYWHKPNTKSRTNRAAQILGRLLEDGFAERDGAGLAGDPYRWRAKE